MNLREKHDALLALRPFARSLRADQVALFHAIATRYQGPAEAFEESVMREFREATSCAVDEIAVRVAVIRALGGEEVMDTVAALRAVWPQLHPLTRSCVVSDIETAIAYRQAGPRAAVGLWKEILALAEATAEPRVGLAELRTAAADAAYAAHDFGDVGVVEAAPWQHAAGSAAWVRFIEVADAPGEPARSGHFAVIFEPDTAVVREVYARSHGRRLAPATTSLAR